MDRRTLEPPAVPPAGPWLGFVVVTAGALYGWYILRNSFAVDGHRAFSLFDDAMISMRYARNLVHGAGLRWNEGERPVEGYTNFLWTLWMAVLQLLPIGQRSVSLLVSLTSASILLANLALVRRLVACVGGRPPSAVLAVVFCAVCYPLVFWSLRGLEVGLLAFLIDAAILLAWQAMDTPDRRGPWLLVPVLSVIVLVRDDALVPAVVIAGFLAAEDRSRKLASACALALGASLAGHVLFRLAYYGAPLPNTYYLKLGGIPLAARLTRGLIVVLRTLLAELLLPVVLAVFALSARRSDRRVRLLVAVIVAQIAYAISVGGDAWSSFGQPDRFVSVVLPALTVAAALGAEAVWVGYDLRGPTLVFAAALAWRAFAVAFGDFVPTSFIVTQPLELDRGLQGLRDTWGRGLAGALIGGALALALVLAKSRTQRPPAWFPIALAFLGITATVGTNWRDYLRGELTGRQIDWDSHTAIFGVRLGEELPPTTSIAVVAAGAIPFFSNLPAVDLLGKSDAHIARELPRERFTPGHDKRDYVYSLSTYKPDLVVELWHHGPEELRDISGLGYQKLPNGMYVRADCPPALEDAILHRLPDYPFGAHQPR